MNKIIEDKELLTIGRFTLDVSNAQMGKKKIARRVWDEAVKEMGKDKEYDLIVFDDIIDVYGLYLMRQNLAVLARRMPFIKAVWSYIKRYMLTVKYIRKTNETEYNNFQEWAYFNITGVKKKELETTNQIQKMEIMALEELQKMNIKPEQLTELLRTFLQETAGNMNISIPSQKA